MNPNDPCPFCGGAKIKKLPYSDKINKIGTGIALPDASGSAAIDIDKNPEQEPHFKCNGCNRKYVDAERDIQGVMNNLQVETNIAISIRQIYHENVSVTDLLTKYRTAMVRKPSHFLSFLTEHAAQRELLICFLYKGIRTFASFVRVFDKNTKTHYYEMRTLSVV